MSGPSTQKIIVLASSILAICLSLHLIGVYLYAWGHYEGVRWGSISIGIVAPAPQVLDPFQYGSTSTTDLMFRFLFRGMIRYDSTTGIYTGDLMNCDLADMTHIRCTIRDDAVWSDSTRVKIEDIMASVSAFAKHTPSADMSNWIWSLSLQRQGDVLEIRSKSKSPHMLELLTYPILRSDTIALIEAGTITPSTYVTSGPYILMESVTDGEYGYDRITLVRNEKSKRNVWLDKIHFKFFKDLSSLERSTETLTIVIPPTQNEKLDIGPRFREYLYTKYEYFGVFLNTKSMSRLLRNSLHWQIGTSFSGNIVDDHRRVDTIFLSGSKVLPTADLKGFSDILRDLGYTKKTEILSHIDAISTTVSGEAELPKAKYWSTRSGSTVVFASDIKTDDGISLTGKIPSSTTSVTINGYTLREFTPGNTNFVYRVTVGSGTLMEWKNTYTLHLGAATGSWDTETLTVYMSQDPIKLESYKQEVRDAYLATVNTPAMIADRERKKTELIKIAQELKDEYYYNGSGSIFSIKIAYTTGPQSTELYAQSIDAALRLLGVKTDLVPYDSKAVQAMIADWSRPYDLLVIGASVDGSLSSIARLFATSEARKGGVNFASIENKTLDSLFTELSSTTDATRIDTIEDNITKIMNTESFFVPISSPYHRLWVDRNIEGIPSVDVIPDVASLVDVFAGTSIKKTYIRSTEGKSIWGWFSWIFSNI